MMVRAGLRVIQAHFKKRQRALQSQGITDPRAARGKRYSLARVWRTALLSLCLLSQSARRAVAVGRDLSGRVVCRIGRTALSDLVSRLDPGEVRRNLHAQVHEEFHRKSLRPWGLPVGVVAIDGKTVWTGDEKVNGSCERSHIEDGTPYWHFRVVWAVLVSAAAPVCIDQMPIPADTNDMGVLPAFLDGLRLKYGKGRLFEILTMDAGFCSQANARLVHDADYAYVFGLKGNQPDLHAEAQRVLRALADATPPMAASDWECERGKRVQRRFWRTTDLAGWLDWSHLRQVWMVRRVGQRDGEPERVVDEPSHALPLRLDGSLNHASTNDRCSSVRDNGRRERHPACERSGWSAASSSATQSPSESRRGGSSLPTCPREWVLGFLGTTP